VDASLTRGGATYIFVDTAGIRRKGKTRLMAEKLSVVMARRHLRLADVVLLVLDASEGVVGLDATIAGYAHEAGRALILCANKWDLEPEGDRRAFEQALRDQLKFLDYAPLAFLSARTGTGVAKLLPRIRQAYEASGRRVTTGELNRFLESVNMPREPRVLYITQGGVRPPTFVLFTSGPAPLHFSDERRLVNQLRRRFDFTATPIVLKTKFRRRRSG
jgi:GTP-binding protein